MSSNERKNDMEVNVTVKDPNGNSSCFEGSFWCSSRFALIIVSFFGFINLYALRVNMSVAIVCMTRQMSLDTNTSRTESDSDENISKESNQDDRFDWSKETQGLILSSFFLGYILTQFPSGLLARKYGGKVLYGWAMVLCVASTFLTPLAARSHVALLIAIRAFAGICQGVAYPCMQTLLSHWIPPLQRSKAVGFVFAGTQVGMIVAFPISGVLCAEGFDGGWPSIFYVFGALGLVWFPVWMYVVSDSPLSHPRISKKERIYIVNILKSELDLSEKSFRTPWLKIFTSLPVWAIIITQTCAEWGTYTLLTNIPTYMEEILKFEIKKAGYLASLPYLGFWTVCNISAYFADSFRRRGCMSTSAIRKLFNSIGNVVPALCVVIVGNIAHSPDIAVAMLTVGVAMSGCQYGSGFIVNPIDLAPRYAGIILSISNTAGTLGGIFAPFAAGVITTDKTEEQWKIVFYVAAAAYVFGATFYVVFGSGELQPWALDERDDRTIDITNKEKTNYEVKEVDELRCNAYTIQTV